MNCPGCGHDNRAGAQFCEECGARFARSCASCNTELRAGAKFCDACGSPTETGESGKASEPQRIPRDYTPKHLADKILQSKSALEGERKQVTVMFADLRSSMKISEGIDPEQWHRIMERFFAILSDGIHRFEGTINQFRGDGIMAPFPAAVAAVQAGIAIQSEMAGGEVLGHWGREGGRRLIPPWVRAQNSRPPRDTVER